MAEKRRKGNGPSGSLHDFTVTTLSKEQLPLSSLAGKVVVCINVASL